MLKKIVQLLAATMCLVVFAGAAQAAEFDDYGDDSAEMDESFWGVGARFAWDNFRKPVLVYNEENNPGIPSQAYGGQNFGGMLMWGISEQLVLSLSVEIGFWNQFIHPYTSTGISDAVNVNFFTIGAVIGAKYYFTPPESRRVRLYVYGGVGYQFSKAMNSANVTTEQNQVLNIGRAEWAAATDADCATTQTLGLCKETGAPGKVTEEEYLTYIQGTSDYAKAEEADTFSQDKFDAEVDMVSRLASPIVLQLALGAEFFVSNNFSVGADIIGLRGEFSWADVGRIEQTFTGDPWTGNQRILNLYLYSAITMSFNLTSPAEVPVAYDAAAGGQAPSGQSTTGWSGGSGWTTGPAAPSATTPKSEPSEPVAPGSSISVPASGDEPPPPPPVESK